QLLRYRAFHPDGCGGYGIVGDISFATIMAVMCLYGSLGVVVVTHHKPNILQISGFVLLSISLVALTYLVAWPVTRFMVVCHRTMRTQAYHQATSKRDSYSTTRLLWLT